jgi:OmcA/MtrC family decaheme c-type cytochrome
MGRLCLGDRAGSGCATASSAVTRSASGEKSRGEGGSMKRRVRSTALPFVTLLFVAAACTGPAGPAGPPGTAGPTGDAGPPGNFPGVVLTIPGNATPPSAVSSALWAALAPQVTIQSVTIQSPPVVRFSVTDATTGLPVAGLGSASKSSSATVAGLTNLSFALAKLVPGSSGSPSKWVTYMVTTVPTTTAPAAPSRPTTDNTGTLVDNQDGTYVYTFYRDVTQVKDQVAAMTVNPPNNKDDLGDLTYDPSLVHRLTIQLSGSAPGTGTNTPNGVQLVPGVVLPRPVDAIYDFVPSTGQAVADSGRDIVATAKCNECHRVLSGIPGDDPESSAAGFHGGNRNETRYCAVCHTEQRKYGRTEATIDPATLTFSSQTYRVNDRAIGDQPNNIHHLHLGSILAKKKYDYAGVLYNEVKFPQDIRNCTKCHDGSDTSTAKTPQGDNWKNVPSRLACGGCHDGIDFATGKGVTLADAAKGLTESPGNAHLGGAQADDSRCAGCHPPSSIDVDHLPVTPPNSQSALHVTGGSANTNAAWIASNRDRLPSGAIKVDSDIQSVSVNASGQPVIVFRMLQNGARKDFNDFATAPVDPKTGSKELWENFMGAPSLYFVFAVPQDGIAAPADYNATVNGYLKSIWSGTSSGSGRGTLSAPDANGYYTGTLTGVTIPPSAVMLTGGVGYSYNVVSTLPLTQTNLSAYPVSAPTASGQTNKIGGLIVIAPNVSKVATGYSGRRPIVEDARCDKCHQQLGVFTKDSFHGGQRNDAATCSWCHRPNQTGSGWTSDSIAFVHAIHASARRTVPFTWDAVSKTDSFADVKYPGILRDCETCHVPGSYDFRASASADALPNRLYRTAATGIFNGTPGTTITTYSFNSGSGTCVAGQSAPQSELGVFELSPYVAALTNYGFGYVFNAGLNATNSCKPDGTLVTNPPGGTVQADPITLVNSPIATACFGCHDGEVESAHMQLNGGSIYEPRSTALAKTESCMICHGPGKIADIKVMHAP